MAPSTHARRAAVSSTSAAPVSLYGDATFAADSELDAINDPAHLASELQAVKTRVRRRRGMIALPVLVVATVTAAAYVTMLDPVTGNRVEVVSEATETSGRPGGSESNDESLDDVTAADPGSAQTAAAPDVRDPSEAAPASDDTSPSDTSSGNTSPGVAAATAGESGVTGASADASQSGAGADAATDTTDPSNPSSGVAAPDSGDSNPPAVPIEFDASTVITRQSPDSAPLPTPPVAVAEPSGVPAGDHARSDSGPGANNSDAEVGAAALTGSPPRTGGDDGALAPTLPGDGLEGPLDASPEPSIFTDNPSIGGNEGSGEGANSAAISFEDDGSAPQLSALSSADLEAEATPNVAEPKTLAPPAVSLASQQVTVALTAADAAGAAVDPCGLIVDWGDGLFDAIPCGTDCSLGDLTSVIEVSVEHHYFEPGVVGISFAPDGSGCLNVDLPIMHVTLIGG